jgi:nitrite reductase/ring-hydroxylating ferredoxin subunit
VGRFLTRLLDAQAGWARPLGDFNHWWLSALFRPLGPVKDLLHGRWLGHPLHSATTDIPIGILGMVIVFDVLGQRTAADVSLVVGILFMLASALAGSADYVDTDGTARVRATVHATVMVVTLVVYLLSLVIRAGNPVDRTFPVLLSVIGFVLVTAGAWIGGDVVYMLGNMVNRHAWRGAGTKWLPIEAGGADLAALPEATPVKVRLGINNLVLVRQGDTIQALHEVCAHAGGPLSEGTLVEGCIQCPWHGSRFDLATGYARRGPTVYDQPRYEVRRGETGWEARRA